IHVGNKGVCPGFNNGEAVMGLHSYDGTIYRPPVNATMHNAVGGAGPYNQWTMSNTAYRYTSPCASSSGACATLPINFKNFSGENINAINKLNWETSEESNIKHFSIERSIDGINFLEIGTQTPNNTASKYEFNDISYKPNTIHYYRINAIENNGEQKRTFIIPIGGIYDLLSVSELYPNPASDNFSISFNSKAETGFVIKLKDLYGRTVKSSAHIVNTGVSEISVSTSGLSSGAYIVEVFDNSGNVISKQKLILLH
ncbi:MAG: T9SS type A sorting domain-containing protein, partial [Bacteroidetes bacterium]|nr:T9SS type A sorting domain-containing protein [Bacteroidota bacterium]